MSCSPRPKRLKTTQEAIDPHAVGHCVIDVFKQLPKKGKPQPNEFTTLAGIVMARENQGLRAVALGTGTKCLSASRRRDDAGDVINDSHAEVVARRAFISWLISELEKSWKSMVDSSILQDQNPSMNSVLDAGDIFWYNMEQKKFEITPGISFHLFTSRLPCGDCAIVNLPMAVNEFSKDNIHETSRACPQQVNNMKRELDLVTTPDEDGRKGKSQERAHHTGAKLIQRQSPLNKSMIGKELFQNVPGQSDVESGPQQLGAIRRKPGRGEATLSMSCSDKLARWGMLGLQGAVLIELLIAPLYLSSVTVALANGQEETGTLAALHRGLIGRCEEIAKRLKEPYRLSNPQLFAVAMHLDDLPLADSAVRTVASGTSINWSVGPDTSSPTHEVTLGTTGRKLGATKKVKGEVSQKTASRLCSLTLGSRIGTLLANFSCKIPNSTVDCAGSHTTQNLKRDWGLKHQEQFSMLRKSPSPFEMWILKR